MVRLAREGKHVVRLKSGDPMVFGRAGEEIARLDAEGIPVDVVPGITAGLALAATLGLSLTHRDFARSVRFVTAHSRHGGLPHDLDWRAVADPSATTILYMAKRTGAAIVGKLLAFGIAPDMPVVIASALSRPEQQLLHGSLDTLSSQLKAIEGHGPFVIGVGRAFEARHRKSLPINSGHRAQSHLLAADGS
jgi:uroporphyrin-III C-methyltransferase/precorrin-2 dehydrogenase/sirohydrochlorin ferrochelatase